MRCKMGADLEADNPQALILLPCGRFPGNPFPVTRDGAVKPVGIDTSHAGAIIDIDWRTTPIYPI